MSRFAFRSLRLGAILALAVAAAPVHAQTASGGSQNTPKPPQEVLNTGGGGVNVVGGADQIQFYQALKNTTDANSFLTLISQPKNIEEELLGTKLLPLSPVQRAQIDIPEGQGLIVGGVTPNSAADQIGLRANDIVLTLSDKPLAKPEDFNEVLKTSRPGNTLTLLFLRKGKRETVDLKPVSVITFGPVAKVEKSYMIGVSVGPVDEVLNAQFDGKLEGLVVNELVAGKPAEKAGIKVGDILVRIDDQPLTTTEQLTEKVRASEGKPVLIHYRRRDSIDSVKLTPVPRETPVAAENQALRLYTLGMQAHPGMILDRFNPEQHRAEMAELVKLNLKLKEADPESRVAAIEKEIEGLKRQLAEIQELIKAQGKK